MLGLGTALPRQVDLSPAGLDRVEAVVRDYVDRGEVAGAVTLTARHGRIANVGVYGMNDHLQRRRMRRDTIFRIFSMTKPVTALAMAILADRGMWKPMEPISTYLPELAERDVAFVDSSGRVSRAMARHQPLMIELLTHTAGFAYGTQTEDPVDRIYQQAGVLGADGADDLVTRVAHLPLAQHPGEGFRYSISTDLQGAIVERLTGQRLDRFMKREIFSPLGMNCTGFYVPPGYRDRVAQMYRFQSDHLVPTENPLFNDWTERPAIAWGGMGLYSTVDDYAGSPNCYSTKAVGMGLV